MAKILAFQLAEPELNKVKRAAGSLKIRVETVPVVLYRQSIKTLCQKQMASLTEAVQMEAETERFTGQAPKGSLLVFCELEEKQFDKILAALKKNAVQIDYKAVLTQTNGKWNVLRMYAEMERERSQIGD